MYDLTEIFLFSGLEGIEIEKIEKLLPPKQIFLKGEVIYSTDQYEKALGVVLSGGCRAYSGEVTKRSFGTGDVFGAAAVFGDTDSYVSEIVATSDCTVQLIPENVLMLLFEKYPKTSLNYVRFLTNKVRFLNQKIAQFSSKSVTQRLYAYLLQSANYDGIITVPSMTEITRQTGIGRTSLYRCLEELTVKGLIERKNNTIRLCEK